jgi:hypothetical protein
MKVTGQQAQDRFIGGALSRSCFDADLQGAIAPPFHDIPRGAGEHPHPNALLLSSGVRFFHSRERKKLCKSLSIMKATSGVTSIIPNGGTICRKGRSSGSLST